ncbi:cobaltochelatase subunit CobN [Candidatus Methanomassiliicoccus intestinalis]|uniref:cobaltochelatase subunit CobN n=1 Tax=Candidatus Methanomassiliicoccus intestinalis TaxID=1406512 RepID=UPI0037DC86DC
MSLMITIISVSIPAVREVCRYAEINKENTNLTFRIYYLGENAKTNLDEMKEDIENADVLLTDLMGVDQTVFSIIVKSMKICKGQRLALGGMAPSLSRLGGYDASRFRMNETDEENLHRINECWKRAQYEDIEYIFNMILKKYLNQDYLPDVSYNFIREGVYIKDPITNKEYDSIDEYNLDHPASHSGKVLITYSGNNYPTKNTEGIRLLFNKICEFADVLPIAMNSYNIRYVELMKSICGNPDVIVNVLPFRFMAGPMGGDSVSAVDLLRDLDATYISPFFLTKSTKEEWESSKAGINPMEFMLNIFLPELDGALCTIPLGFNKEIEYLDDYGLSVTEVMPLEDRVERIAGKVKNYIKLRKKKNSEKRVAIISYNYPPGEGNLFGGSFLNGAGSISNILNMLSSDGYYVKRISPDDLIEQFINEGILNDGRWMSPSERIIRYADKSAHPQQVIKTWGKAPGKVMVIDRDYMIPGIINGNVFIGIQPPRTSDDDDAAKQYHDQEMPPHHQYLAMYEWIENVFKADVVIHLGTHGTLEFLPGKESAMSSQCYPDLIMRDMVHIYIYYSGNPSEAMIAKRRSHACLVSYMPPPFIRSEIYGELAELEEAIAEYRESVKTDSGRGEVLHESIISKAGEMRLPTDINELEDELISIRNSLIPKGLHTFGTAYSQDEGESYAINSMKFPHDDIIQLENLLKDADDDAIARIYHNYNVSNQIPEDLCKNEDAVKTLEYEYILVEKSTTSKELSGLQKALCGRFIDVKPGGDSMKNPEIFPTGCNIVQFNPDYVPTMAAFERGMQAAEDTIQQYKIKNGEYPHSVALVLWGLETSRTQGLTIGQLCWYLGLKLVKTSGNFTDRFEVIPLSELGRPRIDVIVSMCGFFRDMFPNLVTGLSQLFSMIQSLDETEDLNYYKLHTNNNRTFLESKGYSGTELNDLSECRLFGPAKGEYGTSITKAVNESSWKDENELGDIFENSLHYAYSRKFHGHDVEGLLRNNHVNVDVVTQVRDSIDRELIDLDHYYEFLGGLSKTVETARGGNKASVFVVDGSGYKVRTQDVKRSIEHGIRTRLLNPKWIDGLLEVKYHGAQNVNDRFENVLGLAATLGEVDSSVFSDMLKCYVEDADMQRRMRENNNWAYMSMLERLSEANSRGYWNADEKELEILRNAYEKSEEIAESETDVIRK